MYSYAVMKRLYARSTSYNACQSKACCPAYDGWGVFNLVEGTIDHHILHNHHVTEADNQLLWDLVFLTSGIKATVCCTY